MSYVLCHWSLVDGGDGEDVLSHDFSRYPVFVVTTSVVTALLGVSQVTHPSEDPPVPKQALKPLMVGVTALAKKRLKSGR